MERIIPNQFNNLLSNILLFRNSQIVSMKKLLLILVGALFCVHTNAQDNRTGSGAALMDVNSYIAFLRSTETTGRSASSNATRLESLLKDVQPAVYLDRSNIRTFGDNPTALYTTVRSLQEVVSLVSTKEHIEIVTIGINQDSDLSLPIDLSVFSGFPNLKYVYILSSVETTGAVIGNLLRNNNTRFGVFYKVDKGS